MRHEHPFASPAIVRALTKKAYRTYVHSVYQNW
jgi:hypothetical protein